MDAEALMREAFGEALKGLGRTGPNPCVGAFVVRDGTVVARGYHRKAGEPHAEIEAMRDAEARGIALQGSSVVVTLEPCNHMGRTGPCTEALIAAGVRHVIYGCSDPNPMVAGRGVARLLEAGVTVEGPVLEQEALALIADFAVGIAERRPWIIGKIACSIDGRVATRGGESKWITSEASRAIGRRLRGQVQAIATGVETVIADDPQLTAREGGSDPLVVVFDSRLRIPRHARVLAGASPPIIVTTAEGEVAGANVWRLAGQRPDAKTAAERLYRERGIMRLLVEGGPTLLGSFADAALLDELHVFVAPMLFGGAAKQALGGLGVETIAQARRMHLQSLERIGDDFQAIYVKR